MKRQSGFTLLEILLVMLLLAGVASLVVFTLPNSAQEELKRNIDTLALQIDKISDDALIQGKTYGLAVEENRYYFVVLSKTGWESLTEDAMELAPNTTLRVEKVEGDVAIKANNMQSTNSPEAQNQPSKKVDFTPNIYFWSDGTLTPFELLLSNHGLQYQLSVDALGNAEKTTKNIVANE